MQSPFSVIKIASFSTNFDTISPLGLIKKFFISTVCKNISYLKDGHVEFDHNLPDSSFCHAHFVEIQRLDKKYSICGLADCYMIIIDLENDTTYSKIERIFYHMKEHCNLEKKIHILGVYHDSKLITPLMNEEAISIFLSDQHLYHDYYEVEYENTIDLVKIIDFIFQEVLEEKKTGMKEAKNKRRTDIDDDKSNSGCLII